MMELESVIQVTQKYNLSPNNATTGGKQGVSGPLGGGVIGLIGGGGGGGGREGTTAVMGGCIGGPELDFSRDNDDYDVEEGVDDGNNDRDLLENMGVLVSRCPAVPHLSLNVYKFASHAWNDCTFVSAAGKAEYQVKNVPIAHYGIKDVLIIGACPGKFI